MTGGSQRRLGARAAGRLEGEPDSQQPVEHSTRPRDHPRKTTRPYPGTHAPSAPSLAQASAAHLRYWPSDISDSARGRALDSKAYAGCRNLRINNFVRKNALSAEWNVSAA